MDTIPVTPGLPLPPRPEGTMDVFLVPFKGRASEDAVSVNPPIAPARWSLAIRVTEAKGRVMQVARMYGEGRPVLSMPWCLAAFTIGGPG